MTAKPRVVRKVITAHKTCGVMNGKPKKVRDYRFNISVERIKSQMPRQCDARRACLWGGTIDSGDYFARFDTGVSRRIGQGRRIPEIDEYHFSCLPDIAQPMRRFFDALPWQMTLCLDDTQPIIRRYFASPQEWHLWLAIHHPVLADPQHFHFDTPVSKMRGPDYHWTVLNARKPSKWGRTYSE